MPDLSAIKVIHRSEPRPGCMGGIEYTEFFENGGWMTYTKFTDEEVIRMRDGCLMALEYVKTHDIVL